MPVEVVDNGEHRQPLPVAVADQTLSPGAQPIQVELIADGEIGLGRVLDLLILFLGRDAHHVRGRMTASEVAPRVAPAVPARLGWPASRTAPRSTADRLPIR